MKNIIFFLFVSFLVIAGLFIYFTGEVAIGLDKGYTMPNLILPDAKNQKQALYDYSSDYILLEVWATWCPNCRRENKAMIPTIDRYQKSLQVIAISLDSDSALWEKVKRDEMSPHILHYRDPAGWNSKYAEQLKIEELPFNILMNKEFLIIDKNVYAEKLAKLLQQ